MKNIYLEKARLKQAWLLKISAKIMMSVVVWQKIKREKALDICLENTVIPGRFQMERFIPVEIFRKKSNTFRGITFSPFLPKRPKFFLLFVWLTSARLPFKAEGEKWRVFSLDYTGRLH